MIKNTILVIVILSITFGIVNLVSYCYNNWNTLIFIVPTILVITITVVVIGAIIIKNLKAKSK